MTGMTGYYSLTAYTSTATTSSTTYYTPCYSSSTAADGDIHWRAWGYGTIYYQSYTLIYENPPVPTPETEEEKKVRIEAYKKRQAEEKKRQAEEAKAKVKADELLKTHIGLEAFGRLHQVGYLEMDSQKYPGRKYHVPKNARDSLEIWENGRVVDRLCIHTRERYQDGDEILTRVTLLKYAEELLLKTANHSLVSEPNLVIGEYGRAEVLN